MPRSRKRRRSGGDGDVEERASKKAKTHDDSGIVAQSDVKARAHHPKKTVFHYSSDEEEDAPPTSSAPHVDSDAGPSSVAEHAHDVSADAGGGSGGGSGGGGQENPAAHHDDRGGKRKKSKKEAVHGNYDRYYGYRHMRGQPDVRLSAMDAAWFREKMVLDVGCNSGIVTLAVACDFEPHHITGIDLDGNLIKQCERNKKWWVKSLEASAGADWLPEAGNTPSEKAQFFPVSLPLCRGAPSGRDVSLFSAKPNAFPFNVAFRQCDILKDHGLSEGSFDVVMCLSVTKWVHLWHGDEGVLRLFNVMFDLLAPGGILILEPQSWKSYRKRYCMNETFKKNFREIKIRPVEFALVLQKNIGFESVHVLSMPHRDEKKGFRRPVYVCRKPAAASIEREDADETTSNDAAARGDKEDA